MLGLMVESSRNISSGDAAGSALRFSSPQYMQSSVALGLSRSTASLVRHLDRPDCRSSSARALSPLGRLAAARAQDVLAHLVKVVQDLAAVPIPGEPLLGPRPAPVNLQRVPRDSGKEFDFPFRCELASYAMWRCRVAAHALTFACDRPTHAVRSREFLVSF